MVAGAGGAGRIGPPPNKPSRTAKFVYSGVQPPQNASVVDSRPSAQQTGAAEYGNVLLTYEPHRDMEPELAPGIEQWPGREPEPEPEPEPERVAGEATQARHATFAVRVSTGTAATVRLSRAGFSVEYKSGEPAQLYAFELLRRWAEVEGEGVVLTTMSGEDVWLWTQEGGALCAAAASMSHARLEQHQTTQKLPTGGSTFYLHLTKCGTPATLGVSATGFSIVTADTEQPQLWPFDRLRGWTDVEGQRMQISPIIGEDLQLTTSESQAICAAAEAALQPRLSIHGPGFKVDAQRGHDIQSATLHVNASGFVLTGLGDNCVYPFKSLRSWVHIEDEALVLYPSDITIPEIQFATRNGAEICAAAEVAVRVSQQLLEACDTSENGSDDVTEEDWVNWEKMYGRRLLPQEAYDMQKADEAEVAADAQTLVQEAYSYDTGEGGSSDAQDSGLRSLQPDEVTRMVIADECQVEIELLLAAQGKLMEEIGALGKRLQAEKEARATVENQLLESEVEARRKVEAAAAAAEAKAAEERFAEACKGGKAVFGCAEVGAWLAGWSLDAERQPSERKEAVRKALASPVLPPKPLASSSPDRLERSGPEPAVRVSLLEAGVELKYWAAEADLRIAKEKAAVARESLSLRPTHSEACTFAPRKVEGTICGAQSVAAWLASPSKLDGKTQAATAVSPEHGSSATSSPAKSESLSPVLSPLPRTVSATSVRGDILQAQSSQRRWRHVAAQEQEQEQKGQTKSPTAIASLCCDGSEVDSRLQFFNRRLALLGPAVVTPGANNSDSSSSDEADDDEDSRELLAAMVHRSNDGSVPWHPRSDEEGNVSSLPRWSACTVAAERLESRGVEQVESPAARLGMLLNPMLSVGSESSDDSSSLSGEEFDDESSSLSGDDFDKAYSEAQMLNLATSNRQHDGRLSSATEDLFTNTDDEQYSCGSESESRNNDDPKDVSTGLVEGGEDKLVPKSIGQSVKPLWKPAKDKATGKTYYFHRYTRETSWTRPPENDTEFTAADNDELRHPLNKKPVLGAC